MRWGQRGYKVLLAEAENELGGRVSRECRLPGLNAWSRVRDYRLTQLQQMANVNIYPASRMGAQEVLETGCSLVAIATGASWARDGLGRTHHHPLPEVEDARVFSPDDIMNGVDIAGPVVIYDDDHYYMGSVMAELLRDRGLEVSLVTPSTVVSEFGDYTLEQEQVQSKLMRMGVRIVPLHNLSAIDSDGMVLTCVYTGKPSRVDAASIVLVTSRIPNDALYHELMGDEDTLADAGVKRVTQIGDCYAPGIIAVAVYAGHEYARELGVERVDEVPFKRELV